mgnify:CR=1 FL=1
MSRKNRNPKQNLGYSDKELKRLRRLYVKGNNEESEDKDNKKDEKKENV